MYSWEKVSFAAEKRSERIIDIMFYLVYGRERRKHTGLYNYDFSGMSFLVRPKKLLTNVRKHKSLYVAQYIAFASIRNLGECKLLGRPDLNLRYVPEKLLKFIKPNPLLKITSDNYIQFLYER